MNEKKGMKEVKSSISNPSYLSSPSHTSVDTPANQSTNENKKVDSSESSVNMSSSRAMYQKKILNNDTSRQQYNPVKSHSGEVAQRQNHHFPVNPGILEGYPNQNYSMSLHHTLYVGDGVNDNTNMQLYHQQQQQYSVPPMLEHVNKSIPAPYPIDSATGLPLHMLDKLHELLPIASNSKQRNKNETSSASSSRLQNEEENIHEKAIPTLESIRSFENVQVTIPSSNQSPVPSLRHQNTIIDSTSFTTHSTIPSPHSLPNEYIQPNNQHVPPKHPISSSTSTTSVINNLKTSNQQLEKSIASGNMHNAKLEIRYKMLDSDCNAYNHIIQDLNAKLETEKQFRVSSVQRKNVKNDKDDTIKSGSKNELHTIDKYDKIRSNANETRDNNRQMNDASEDDSILIEKIKSLENELNTERMRAKTTFESMEKDLFEEIHKLSIEQDGIKKHLLSEHQYLSKTNKLLLDEVKEKTVELKKRGVEV